MEGGVGKETLKKYKCLLILGEYVRNSLLPDDETLGGISSIFDKSSKVDLSHTVSYFF